MNEDPTSSIPYKLDEICITQMTKDFAQTILEWKYDGPYSIYNHDERFANECLDGNHFAFTNAGGLLGYFCFGPEARIPTIEENSYDDNFLDIGLHMHPDLVGRKLGSKFLRLCINYAWDNERVNRFRATIASFNARAINLCVNSGFRIEKEVTHLHSQKKFTIVKYKPVF